MNASHPGDPTERRPGRKEPPSGAWSVAAKAGCLLLAAALLARLFFNTELALLKICLGLFFLFLFILFTVRTTFVRNISLVFIALCLSLAVLDIAVRVSDAQAENGTTKHTYSRGYFRHNRVLGTVPAHPGKFESNLRGPAGQQIYDVTYTIDEDGFRHVPGNDGAPPTYLFFGGSFTYGEGVEDAEAYPAIFEAALGSGTVVNLGFQGYGPHQMLRTIESGLFDGEIRGKVARAFYLLWSAHVNRVIGLYDWTYRSPRYVLGDDGGLRSAGLYSDWWVRQWLRSARSEGGLLKLLAERAYELIFPARARQMLTAAIIGKSARLLKEKYGTSLTCLVWDGAGWHGGDHEGLVEALGRQGIELIPVSRFLGDLGDPAYYIPHDGHPTPLAHRRLGEALADWASGTPGE